ncbi:inner membrane protein [Natronobacterium gregoryi]|uniref:Membrane-bound metal-dependent hydrolase n=2 Tax=Natronobacterium gregoryi TaxID=44930 RepID=L0AE05_NATGS|nr:putative membrane-bound metal-dependent hydrolase [Natronobacterium gregoryi SP2]SFJ65234.1 inner membrane protein [Natronobacterium gregoryi]
MTLDLYAAFAETELMYQAGHYGAALLVYAPLGTAVALFGGDGVALVGAFVCVSLSTVPDLDHRLPLVAHRGPTHTVAFALLVGVTMAALAAVLVEPGSPLAGTALVTFAFVVGTLSIVSHLLADVLTPMGIRPFWPISSRHYSLEVTRAANPVANYALLALGVGSVVIAATLVAVFG